MDTQSILSLIDTFYAPGFDLAAALAHFGDGAPPMRLRPYQLKLGSNDPEIAAIFLETLDPITPSQEPFLAGVVLKLAEPARIRFATLAERLGPPREMPRLKPHDPVPYQFAVRRTPFEGYLTLEVVNLEEADPRQVVRVILRRLAPGSNAA